MKYLLALFLLTSISVKGQSKTIIDSNVHIQNYSIFIDASKDTRMNYTVAYTPFKASATKIISYRWGYTKTVEIVKSASSTYKIITIFNPKKKRNQFVKQTITLIK